LELIEGGVLDTVLVGGADALARSAMAGFDALRATSTERTAPFSTPAGLNLGEAAAFWLVEEAEVAHARGARVAGEILGYALTADAHHPTAPDPMGVGALRTMENALKRAGIDVHDLGCVNAHGTGTDANDRVESKAIGKLLKGRDIPVYSLKSQVGHCLGAAGIVEATAGLLAMQQGIIPATINFKAPRPGCHLNYVPNHPITASYSRFLSCNYAFGGNNAGVVIGLPHGEKRRKVPPLPRPRTVLTGEGVVTSLGLGSAANLAALGEKQRGLFPLAGRVKQKTAATLAGLIQRFEGRDVDRRIDWRNMKPISRLATAAARLALAEAALRVGPKEGLLTGVINGVNVGPNEEEYLTGVVGSGGADAEVNDFSHVVANATGGWISNALMLRGYSSTQAAGPDAGLFSVLLACHAITGGASSCILAGAADELYSRHLLNYDGIGFLHTGEKERAFGLNLDVPDRRVLGEGAAYVVVESASHASSRGRTPLAEIVGHGMTTDNGAAQLGELELGGLIRAVENALEGAGWTPADVGVVLWTPEGNRNDAKPIEACRAVLGARADSLPFLTTVFNTGLLESTSGVVTLAALIASWSGGLPLWPQMTGLDTFDSRALPTQPVNALVIATSEVGFNLALAIAPFEVQE
jgi:3-oxoacyl-[acyl-carrier-protein] synthase II